MNNKRTGNDFENEFCQILRDENYWVHFITPNQAGAQPFDVIAVKNGTAYAFDCKTCVDRWFRISRLEDNQILAFEKWMMCGNNIPMVAIKHNERIYIVSYIELKTKGKVDLEGNGVHCWK